MLPDGIADRGRAAAIVNGVAFGRDLINTPSNDMGPAEIEEAARTLAKAHGAKITSVVGDDLLAKNFPLIHAVGRASPRAPRLIDLVWQPVGAKGTLPLVTLVGKGIAFDTGGLDLKPSSGMLLMKKDMGGAAAALASDSLPVMTPSWPRGQCPRSGVRVRHIRAGPFRTPPGRSPASKAAGRRIPNRRPAT